MKVHHGALGLVKAETRTIARERRGSLTVVYANLSFASLLTPNRILCRLGMMVGKIPIMATKIMALAEVVVFTATRSVSSPVIPVHTSSFLASISVSRNRTFVSLPTITPLRRHAHDSQLHTFLTGQGCSVETVTIIRERSTGTCPSLASFPGHLH